MTETPDRSAPASPPGRPRLRPSSRLGSVGAYRPTPRPATIDLHLDGNEGLAPPAELWTVGTESATELVRRYPDRAALTARVAAQWDLPPERVLVTAGVDDALDRLCRALLEPGRRLVLPVPTFEMIERYALLTGGEVVPVAWTGGPFPTDAVLAAADDATAAILVVSPNNPTGAVATGADLRRLAAGAPHCLLVVDLAYVDFADDDPTRAALALDRAIVLRTLSKAWGLAGLRVGYALGPAEVIRWLARAGQPYPVSGPSLALAGAWLERGDAALAEYVDRVRHERGELCALLRALGAHAPPSQSNFVLARFRDAAWVRDALAGLGIAVRAWPEREGLRDALRITCPGDADAFARLADALATVLAPEALLLDLDGVIADVSASYREAIRQTAATYGVEVSSADVAAVKAKGDANNDWIVTQRLLSQRGVDAPLAEVTERFEALYQGTPERPGLREREQLRVGPEWLARLAERLPLGVVTGRPRADAARFLDRFALSAHFDVVVAMEDASPKPSPDPVRVALERLGVRRAWMVGDTPDDVAAARAAGAVPIGVVAPGDDATATTRVLRAAGAARVLAEVTDVEELIP